MSRFRLETGADSGYFRGMEGKPAGYSGLIPLGFAVTVIALFTGEIFLRNRSDAILAKWLNLLGPALMLAGLLLTVFKKRPDRGGE
jgi:hypothetical protein